MRTEAAVRQEGILPKITQNVTSAADSEVADDGDGRVNQSMTWDEALEARKT
jgi:hypothetical protein